MAAKISGIKIPVTIDSSGVDAGLNNLKSKLSGNLGTQTTLSTGNGSMFGAGPLGAAFSKGPVGSGLIGQVIATNTAAQIAARAQISTNLSLYWAQASGSRIHTFTPRWEQHQGGSPPPPKTPTTLQTAATQLLSGDFSGFAETAGGALGVGAGVIGLGAAGVGAGIYAGKKFFDFSQAMRNAGANLPASYRQSDPYYKSAYDTARRAQMTAPKGNRSWMEGFGEGAGKPGRAAGSLVGTALGEIFSGETIGLAAVGLGSDVYDALTFGWAINGTPFMENTSKWVGHEYEVFKEWYVRSYGSEKELREMRRANRRAAAAAERTSI